MSPISKPTQKVGEARFVQSRAYQQAGTIYSSAQDALKEYLENSFDAGGDIDIVVTSTSVTIIDNGRGMVPFLPEEDRAIIEAHFQGIKDGTVSPDESVEDKVSVAAKCSLEWSMEYGGLSPKGVSDLMYGQKGWGLRAHLYFSSDMVIYSRANEELAESYWGNAPEAKTRPVYRLTPPNLNRLKRNDTRYEIEQVDQPLRDAEGNVLESGTIVVITGITPGMERQLDPKVLEYYYKSRYADSLSSGRMKLRLWREQHGGKMQKIEVKAAPIQGLPIFEQTLHLPDTTPFDVKIFYQPEGRPKPIQLRRVGTGVRDLKSLPEFNSGVWTDVHLTGFVDYPSNKVAAWNTEKDMPVQNSAYNQFCNALQRSAQSAIEKAIDDYQTRSSDERLRNIDKQVQSAAVKAVNALPSFSDIQIGSIKRDESKEKPEPSGKPPRQQTRVVGKVFNEHNRGVANIRLELYDRQTKKLIMFRDTGISGETSFGRLPEGRYLMKIVPPANVAVNGVSEWPINVTPQKPGQSGIFRVTTNEPKPTTKRIPNFTVYRHAFGTPDLPYRIDLIEKGTLPINSDFTALRRALDDKDAEAIELLMLICTAQAISEYAFKQEYDIPYVMAQANLLFSEMLRETKAGKPTRKRRVKV